MGRMSHSDAILNPGVLQAFPAVGAQCLQDAVTRPVGAAPHDHHRLVDEPGQQIEGVVLGRAVLSAHTVRCVQVEAACEHRQPRKQWSARARKAADTTSRSSPRGSVAVGIAPRAPPLSSRSLSKRRATSRLLIARIRDAASSMARGRPSSRRQISATAPTGSWSEVEVRPARPGSIGEQRRWRRRSTAVRPA